jgi:hypothetical protein
MRLEFLVAGNAVSVGKRQAARKKTFITPILTNFDFIVIYKSPLQ